MHTNTRLLTLIVAVAMGATACSGGDGDATATTAFSPSGMTFTVTVEDDGASLVVRPGDEILADLPLETAASPDWLVTGAPDPAVLSEGTPQRFLPSEEGDAPGQFFVSFVAQGPGTTTVTLTQGPGGSDGPVSFTVEVVDTPEG